MTADIRFRFVLRPIDEVAPWHREDGTALLHWFGLTDGWYWIDTGDHELLRFSESVVERRADRGLPYVDYYVVRLWEDLLEALPFALEPIPVDVFALLLDRDRLNALESRKAECDWDEWMAGTEWVGARAVDTGYLTSAPWLCLCRVVDGSDDDMHLFWDYDHSFTYVNFVLENDHEPDDDAATVYDTGVLSDEPTFVGPIRGSVHVPIDRFIAAVRAFDGSLMDEMRDRVDSLRRHQARVDAHIDLDGLAVEQEHRAERLDVVLDQQHREDWDRVRDALRRLESSELL